MIINKKPFCIIMQWPLWFGKNNGFSFWPFIFYRDSLDKDQDKTTIHHEKIHIRQQLNGWLIGFYVKYLYYQWRYGYKNNPYEIEAYKHQNDWKQADTN